MYTIALLRVSESRQTTESQKPRIYDEIRKRKLIAVSKDDYFKDEKKYKDRTDLCIVAEDKASGTTDKRAGFQWTLAEIKAGRCNAVLTYSIDRIGRNTKHTIDFAETCLAHNIELFSCSEQIDLKSPAGRLLYEQMCSFSAFFSRLLSHKIKDGINAKKQRCVETGVKYYHGGPPTGTISYKIGSKLADFFDMVDLGWSDYKINRVIGWNWRTIQRYKAIGRAEALKRWNEQSKS